MSKGDGRAKKERYFEKLEELLTDYPTIFIVNVDNVGSNQMHQIRRSLRGEAVILMGKNTMIRKKLRALKEDNHDLERLLPVVKGNVGLVFTKATDLKVIRSKITENRVRAPAKAGAIAPSEVTIPAGNTGMEPGKTSFFQALGIPTKIARGTIEIVNDVPLIKPGQKVGASEATLLNMLNISPFTYGLSINYVYDQGTVFTPDLLDIDVEHLAEHFMTGVQNMTKISLALGFPTMASVPHLLVNGYKNILHLAMATAISFKHVDEIRENRLVSQVESIVRDGFKNVLAIALTTGYTFPLAEEIKEERATKQTEALVSQGFRTLVALTLDTKYSFPQGDELKALLDPAALAKALAEAASAHPVAAAPAAAVPAAAKKEEPKKAAPKVEEEEEDDDGGFGGLFD